METTQSPISFAVDEVTPAAEPLCTEAVAVSVPWRLQRNVLVLPGAEEKLVNLSPPLQARGANGPSAVPGNVRSPRQGPAPVPNPTARRMPERQSHSLIDAVHMAFSQHRPLTLSPDAIWLVIQQGFGHHVAENAEELRGRLVRHEGKKALCVATQDLSLESFNHAIAKYSELIRREIDPVLHETLICDFSTTSPSIRTASEVALMDTFSSYFTYGMMCVCGIPTITIEGTPTDWQRMRERVEVLATYGLEWWVSRLRPILDEFVLTAEGRPNKDFWKAIYKPVKAYAATMVTGWLADLFPYLGDAPRRSRNHVLERERRDWAVSIEEGVETGSSFVAFIQAAAASGVAHKRFPSGLSSARINVAFPDHSERALELVAGFMGVKQEAPALALSPWISWCVAELPPEKPIQVF